ncbi:MAG: hypothetical protein MR004_00805 [Clostridiales bacterium]|nr:hypothetical protein [Clostridiales bacterium]MDY4037350.1 hypothetical protein [Candidatus Pseudoscilispira sp.]
MAGATGATGSAGAVSEDAFASFMGSSELFTDGNQLLWFPSVEDTTGSITESGVQHIQLSAGYYLV